LNAILFSNSESILQKQCAAPNCAPSKRFDVLDGRRLATRRSGGSSCVEAAAITCETQRMMSSHHRVTCCHVDVSRITYDENSHNWRMKNSLLVNLEIA
jgi:hydroxymethylpyrimidine/phosphomethylpyrimidine kinase